MDNFLYLSELIINDNFEELQDFIINSKNVNFNEVVDNFNSDLLHISSYFIREIKYFKLLIEVAKIDPSNIKTEYENCLHIVCQKDPFNVELIKYLINNGCDLNQTDEWNHFTPLDYLKIKNLDSYNKVLEYTNKLQQFKGIKIQEELKNN